MLLIIMWPDALVPTPLSLFCFYSFYSTNCCSLLLCGGREQAYACISLRFPQRVARVDQRESPPLEHTLYFPESLQGYRTVLPRQVQLLLELLSLAGYVLAKNTVVPRVL